MTDAPATSSSWTTMLFSIVIPAYNSEKTISLVLRCLENQSVPREEYEVIVVDDGSADRTIAIVSEFQRVRLIRLVPNRGSSQARNSGWREATGRILIFLDSDMLCPPSWLEHYKRRFSERTCPDIVSGQRWHLNLDRDPALVRQLENLKRSNLDFDRASLQFEELHKAAGLGQYPDVLPWESELSEVCARFPDSLVCAYSLWTSNVAVRRTALEAVGGFDTMLKRNEDTDLGLRLWARGYRFAYESLARAYHCYRWEARRNLSLNENIGFFYRNPYHGVLLIHLWQVFKLTGKTAPEPVSSLMAVAQTLANLDENSIDHDLYSRLTINSRSTINCVHSIAALVSYYEDTLGISAGLCRKYLAQAVQRGVLSKRENTNVLFDLPSITNWIRSTVWDEELRRATLACRHEAKLSLSKHRENPATLHVRGRYEIHVPAEFRGRSGAELLVVFPAKDLAQSDPQITSRSAALERAGKRLDDCAVTVQLSDLAPQDNVVWYEFECQVRETLPGQYAARDPLFEDAEYLVPSFPAKQLPKLKMMVMRAAAGRAPDEKGAARSLYEYILRNIRPLESPLPDDTILETGMGTSSQCARLFVNVCRIVGIPARERHGAIISTHEEDGLGRAVTIDRHPFSHIWAEFLAGNEWIPVEFLPMEWLGTSPSNHTDTAGQRAAFLENDLWEQYYFGHLDPFRIYGPSLQRGSSMLIARSGPIPLDLRHGRTQLRSVLRCAFADAAVCAALDTPTAVGKSGL